MPLINFRKKLPPPTPTPDKCYGLFSIGSGDVIVSRPLLEVILAELKAGSTGAQHLATQLEAVLKGMY